MLKIPSKLGKENTFKYRGEFYEKGGALFMDKNEILRRSQEENQYGDEREKQIKAKSKSIGQDMIVWSLIILTIFNAIKGFPVKHFIAILWAGTAAEYYYLFWKNRKKKDLFCGLLATSTSLGNLLLLYLEVFQ